MNTYPVSESEMEQISSLNAQAITRFSIATFLVGIGGSVWTNAMFYKELTPEATVATKFVAPLLIGFGIISAIFGCWAQYKRRSAWTRIKAESIPVQAVSAAKDMVVPAGTPEAAH